MLALKYCSVEIARNITAIKNKIVVGIKSLMNDNSNLSSTENRIKDIIIKIILLIKVSRLYFNNIFTYKKYTKTPIKK